MNADVPSLVALIIKVLALVSLLVAFVSLIVYASIRRKENGSGAPPGRKRSSIAGVIALVSAGVFILSFALIIFVLPVSDPNKRVLDLKGEILNLRGDIEAKNAPETKLRERARNLANSIGEIDERQLRPAVRIIKHEYGGWALVMAVNTFGKAPPRIPTADRIAYATKAVAEFDAALKIMDRMRDSYIANDSKAIPIYKWMTGESEDLNRTRYLKAVALAVIARAEGGPPEAATAEFYEIPPDYRKKISAVINPDLAWALEASNRSSADQGPQ